MRKPAIGIFFEIPIDLEKSFELIKMKLCYANGADVVFFTADNIDEENQCISALKWTPDGLVKETTRIPHWIECGPSSNKWNRYFRKTSRVVDDYCLSKKEVSDAMLKSKFSPYIIPTMYTKHPQRIFTLLNMWQSIILKPIEGARGENIICIKKQSDDQYLISSTSEAIGLFDTNGCISYLTEIYNGIPIIVQPRLNFTNKDGQTMDFRINVTKGTEGKWTPIYMIARTARDKIVSNVSQGGYVSLLDPTLLIDYGENANKIKETFFAIASELPPFMEEISNCNMLSLGIDIGIDYDTLTPYIIEVNYVPQVTFRGKDKYADAVAGYYAYLTKQIREQEQTENN